MGFIFVHHQLQATNDMKYATALLIGVCCCSELLYGQDVPDQHIPDIVEHEDVFDDRSKYIKFSWANDALKVRGITDRYFTNGNVLEYFYLPTNPASYERLFLRMPKTPTRNNNFAVSLSSNMYTPTDITMSAIDSTDRPYAGWLSLGVKCISNELKSGERLTTEYSLGIIGEHAFQKEIQTWFHQQIDSDRPEGWGNQIRDDIALNVRVDYEKGLLRPNKNIEVIGLVEANVGTVTNYMGLGSTIRIGSFNDYFLNELGVRTDPDSEKYRQYKEHTDNFKSRIFFPENLRRKIQCFAFIKSSARVVIDNSLLEGGVINWNKSPYRIDSDKIKRFYFNAEFGVQFVWNRLGIVYSQLLRTAEFEGAFDSRWGSATIIYRVGYSRIKSSIINARYIRNQSKKIDKEE
jgi:lipid A 3-O-deacylase